jgi:branched-chain amino acid transport system ATP-binding protein
VLLEIRNLKVTYGKAQALKGISLVVNKGEVVALVGANGAGKSTILRAISGLVAPCSGEIWFNGKRIDRMRPHRRTRLGIAHVLEGRRVFNALSVQKNLEVGAYVRRDRKSINAEIANVYRIFPTLKARSNQLAGTLSGGEQQMLATGRGLMSKPSLILMDEPSIGLSPLLVREVGKTIKAISQTGTSILLVEQNALLALRLSSRAYVLEIGEIVLQGDSGELLKNEGVKKAYLGG